MALTVAALSSVFQTTNRPSVSLCIHDHEVTGLYDTGAQCSIISDETFRRIPVAKRPSPIPGPTAKLTSVNGKPLNVRGLYPITFDILGREVTHHFYVVRQLKSPVLLGVDFINKHNLSYDAASRSLFFPGPTVASVETKWTEGSIVLANAVTLKPHTSINVQARIMLNPTTLAPTNRTFLLKPYSSKYPITADDGVVHNNDRGLCRFLLTNSSTEELSLPQNTWLGTAEPIDPKEVASIELEEADPPRSTPALATAATPDKRKYLEQSKVYLKTSPQFQSLILKNHDIFSFGKTDIGRTKAMSHSIELTSKEPKFIKQFRIPLSHKTVIMEHLKNWLKLKIVSPSKSKYNSPIFCVLKKDKSLRPVLDYRALNSITVIDKYSGREVSECIDELGKSKSKLFSSLDLTSGFWQLPLDKTSQHLTCFTIPGIGSFQWECTPMGLLGSPSSFQRLMDYVMRNLPSCITYQDDVLVHSRSKEDHIRHLQACFDRLRANGLKLNPEKCSLAQTTVSYLGFTISGDGVLPGIDKTKAIRDFPPPTTVRAIREFTGLTNFFRASVPNYSLISQQLTKLLKKESKWKEGPLPPESLKAFNTLKHKLISPPLLAFPDPDKKFYLYTDASAGNDYAPGGLGACLVQFHNDNPRPIAYASRALLKHEKNYSTYLLELAACVFGITHFDVYLKNRHFFLCCDHRPLEKLSKVHTKTLNRLQQLMLEFNFSIMYNPGKKNAVPDFLSRNVISAVDISYDGLLEAQTKDLDIQHRLKHISKYPHLSSRNGILFYQKPGGNPAIFAPTAFRAQIIQAAHNSLLGGHMGIFKSFKRITQNYYWPNMIKDITDHIKQCHSCQTTRPYNHPPKQPLRPLPQPVNINHRIHVDLFGPLAVTEKQNKFICVITDAFSKYAEIVAIPNKEAKTVADAIFDNWITRFSTPSQIVTDNGKEFCNQICKKLFSRLQILHSTTTPYHPQSNAGAEIFNKTLKRYLQSFLSAPFLEWEQYLPAIRICYNTSVSKATQASPFSLVFGINPNMPFFDLEKYVDYDETRHNVDQLVRLFQARDLARLNNLEYKKSYERTYNQQYQVKKSQLQVGDQVFLQVQSDPKYKNAKLHPRYSGPYEIRDLRQNVATLLTEKGLKKVNLNRLKLAHDSPPTDSIAPTVRYPQDSPLIRPHYNFDLPPGEESVHHDSSKAPSTSSTVSTPTSSRSASPTPSSSSQTRGSRPTSPQPGASGAASVTSFAPQPSAFSQPDLTIVDTTMHSIHDATANPMDLDTTAALPSSPLPPTPAPSGAIPKRPFPRPTSAPSLVKHSSTKRKPSSPAKGDPEPKGPSKGSKWTSMADEIFKPQRVTRASGQAADIPPLPQRPLEYKPTSKFSRPPGKSQSKSKSKTDSSTAKN